MSKNVIYAQAGGVTAVINMSAFGVFAEIKKHPEIFGKTYAAINGVLGVLEENLIDIDATAQTELNKLKSLPGAAFESCRFDLDPIEDNPAQYARVLSVFKAYDIGYFFYNGGNGSMLTAQKVADYCTQQGHPIICIGVAKTIDNDLAISHCSPGFGSAAKYIAASLAEAVMDIHSMHKTSTKFLVMETMGRNAGWLALAGGLVKQVLPDTPLMIMTAEMEFNQHKFFKQVELLIKEKGYCVCVVSEGLRCPSGEFISIENIEHTQTKNFTQLGGAGHTLARMVAEKFKVKTHTIIPDYLQRSASHFVSKTDWEMAYQAGTSAVIAAKNQQHGCIPIIEKTSSSPFKWRFKTIKLSEVANLDKTVPTDYINKNTFSITPKAEQYLLELIQGEVPFKYQQGLPFFDPFKGVKTPPCLVKFDITTP